MRGGVVLIGLALLGVGGLGVGWGYGLLVTSALGPYILPLLAVTCGIPLLFLGVAVLIIGAITRRATQGVQY